MAPNGPRTAYPPPISQITRVLANGWASGLLFTATLDLVIGAAVALAVCLVVVDLVVVVVVAVARHCLACVRTHSRQRLGRAAERDLQRVP
jgi:hypothetical protein